MLSWSNELLMWVETNYNPKYKICLNNRLYKLLLFLLYLRKPNINQLLFKFSLIRVLKNYKSNQTTLILVDSIFSTFFSFLSIISTVFVHFELFSDKLVCGFLFFATFTSIFTGTVFVASISAIRWAWQ